ncbi:hypothetical protein [Flavobacterium sp. HJ-32-4]|uniref:hypothetical protein n=1 Tax=Flavobacterium sp. HJ-32-4 TaxID=1160795 RepID=UPI001F1413E0|nr:hypothetical protein [Flavobacterium sp. HJ-32-4]UMY65300.1 hypothetical protein MKO97_12420 [Flavobacterium sp. HJ-32-4]
MTFSIWHINGQTNYKRSIKLGLNHYLLMVNQVKKHFPFQHRDVINPEFERTWLKILFEKDICIFGLGLDEQEVFIRWLLLERAKYFKRFPEKSRKGWYINFDESSPSNVGKKVLFKERWIQVYRLFLVKINMINSILIFGIRYYKGCS